MPEAGLSGGGAGALRLTQARSAHGDSEGRGLGLSPDSWAVTGRGVVLEQVILVGEALKKGRGEGGFPPSPLPTAGARGPSLKGISAVNYGVHFLR